MPLAKALDVGLDDLLQVAEPAGARHRGPTSKFESLIEQVAQLPRRRQQLITGVLETLVAQEAAEAKRAS